MKEQRITIEIDRDGRITADAEGFGGDTCLAELDRLLEGIAATIATVERKPDTSTARITQPSTRSLGKKR